MKTYGNGGTSPHILNLGTRWKSMVSFTPRTLYPQGKTPGTDWIGWVGPRAGRKGWRREEMSAPAGNRTPVVQPGAVILRSELPRLFGIRFLDIQTVEREIQSHTVGGAKWVVGSCTLESSQAEGRRWSSSLSHTWGALIDGGMMTGQIKAKFSDKRLPWFHFFYHKSQGDCPGIDPGFLRWEVGM